MRIKNERPRRRRRVRKEIPSLGANRLEVISENNIVTEALICQGDAEGSVALAAWANFAAFCDDSFREFTPRDGAKQRTREPLAQVEKKCVHLALQGLPIPLVKLVEENFDDPDIRKTAEKFLYYLERVMHFVR